MSNTAGGFDQQANPDRRSKRELSAIDTSLVETDAATAIEKYKMEYQENLGMVKTKDMSIYALDTETPTWLLRAVKDENLKVAAALLETDPNIINAVTSDGDTPLHIASKGKSGAMVRFLLTKGADVNAVNASGYTPLHYATEFSSSNTASMKELLGRGADVNAINTTTGYTPLHYASSSAANKANMKLLIDRRANVNAVDLSGNTPLHVASSTANLANMKLLIAEGASIDATDHLGRTPLFIVVSSGAMTVTAASFFVEREANLKLVYPNGDTILHACIRDAYIRPPSTSCFKEVVELLVYNGAELCALNDAGETPAALAFRLGDEVRDFMEQLQIKQDELATMHDVFRNALTNDDSA
jgi:ankyrin repeat protein